MSLTKGLMEEAEIEGKVFDLVNDYFEDEGTTERWLRMKNPLLGYVSPREMIKIGRGERLIKFIEVQKLENKL